MYVFSLRFLKEYSIFKFPPPSMLAETEGLNANIKPGLTISYVHICSCEKCELICKAALFDCVQLVRHSAD